MSARSIFIIGAGANVGRSVALRFKREGYRVAVGSRSPNVDGARKDGLFPVTLDVSQEASIGEAFKAVEKEFGAPPNVVVYNREFVQFTKACD